MSETLDPETLKEPATAPELPEGQAPDAPEPDAEAEGEEEIAVSFGDDPPEPEPEPAPEPNQLRQLREQARVLLREKRELQEQLRARDAPPPEIALGPKPELEDFDYDIQKWEPVYIDWAEKKRQVDEKAEQARVAARANDEAWQAKLNKYGQDRAKLKVPDFEEAEERIQHMLPVAQQSAIVHAASDDNPALIFYALSKYPTKTKELANLKLANGHPDVVKFAYELGKLVTQMKTTPRSRPAPPAPETPMRSTAPSRSAANATLERLEAEADRTGDRTKVAAYRRQLNQQARK